MIARLVCHGCPYGMLIHMRLSLLAWSVGSFLNGTTMLHINAQEDTKRTRQELTKLAVAISTTKAELAVHEASASAAKVELAIAQEELAIAQENTKQTRSELTKLAAEAGQTRSELTKLAGAISVTEVELAVVQAASTSAADDE